MNLKIADALLLDPEVKAAVDTIQKKMAEAAVKKQQDKDSLARSRVESRASQDAARDSRVAERELKKAEREKEAALKQKLKRSRGVYPHVDLALTQFETVPGESVSLNDFLIALVEPFPAGKQPACCDNMAAVEIALLPDHPIQDGQVLNLKRKT